MRSVCVIDNSTLVTLTKLHHLSIFSQLSYLFERIHIPLKVKEEYSDEFLLKKEPVRKILINQMRLNSGFLSICTDYDTISLVTLKTTKGIDPGEAEAAAQHKKIFSQFVLSDDKNFIAGLQLADRHIKVLGTLHLIAWLNTLEIIPDTVEHLKLIHHRIQFNSTMLRSAYVKIHQQLGIPINRKLISKKTSLKGLGL